MSRDLAMDAGCVKQHEVWKQHEMSTTGESAMAGWPWPAGYYQSGLDTSRPHHVMLVRQTAGKRLAACHSMPC